MWGLVLKIWWRTSWFIARIQTTNTYWEECWRSSKLKDIKGALKAHFLYARLAFFPENLGDVYEEQLETFQQNIKELERRYQGWGFVSMMTDYCWVIHVKCPANALEWKSSRHSFQVKKKELWGAEPKMKGTLVRISFLILQLHLCPFILLNKVPDTFLLVSFCPMKIYQQMMVYFITELWEILR